MKKIIAYICVFLGLLAMFISQESITNRIWQWNNIHVNSNAFFGKQSYEGGGLSGMAYLDDVKLFNDTKNFTFKKPIDNNIKNIDLYLFGDSFTEDIPDSAFCNTDYFTYNNYTKTLNYDLDKTKINILIIEVSERLIFERYNNYIIFERLKKDSLSITPKLKKKYEVNTTLQIRNTVKNPYSQMMNKNLEYILFDYNFINWVKRLKADMNYYLFNRATGSAVISNNKQFLFYKPTIDPQSTNCIYRQISNKEVNGIVTVLNEIYSHYLNEGFSEVYFSIIPDPAAILQPENYNNLVPQIYNNKLLKMPVLDVYSLFFKQDNPQILFRHGDTHWNNNGMQIWLQLVNDELRKISSSKK